MAGSRKNFENISQSAINHYLYYMLNIKKYSPETLRAYCIDLRQAFQISKALQVPPLKPKGNINCLLFTNEAQLLDLFREAQNNWASLALSTRNRKSACLKSFLKWAYEQKLTINDLSHRIHCPKVPHKLPHFLSLEEVLSVIRALNQEIQDRPQQVSLRQNRALFYLLYGGGLRISEACNLRWNQVHRSKRHLYIKGKGKKERVISLPRNAVKYLFEVHSDQEFVFGQNFSTRKAFSVIRKLGEMANLNKPLNPHALRHSFATHMLSSGSDLRVLQELLGHETLQATQKYTHLNIDHLSQILEKHHPLSK